ncbi:MAG: D-alanine--D-alanine ligase [Thermodesulfobacteriota bacterium]
MKDKKIGVLMGGRSAERKISLKTGEAVLRALKGRSYQVAGIDVDDKIYEKLIKEGIEVAFIALHGRYGEDGTIQGLLEFMGIPYTGSGVTASALAMNKVLAKRLFKCQGVPTPAYTVLSVDKDRLDMPLFQQSSEQNNMVKQFSELNTAVPNALTVVKTAQCKCSDGGLSDLAFPVVVKPPSEGSAIGVRVVYDEDGLRKAICDTGVYSSSILIEEFIDGSEVTVGIIEGEVLPTIEIVPEKGFYDYTAKYTPGMTEYLIPTSLDEETDRNVQRLALKTYETLGCRGGARVDMMIDKDRKPWVLEINTIPGMTETSLLPRSAQSIGIGFDSLVERLLIGARLGE